MNNDLVYLSRRAQEEHSAASHCRHAAVREIHLELAQAYEFRMFVMKQLEKVQTGSVEAGQTSNGDQPLPSPALGAVRAV